MKNYDNRGLSLAQIDELNYLSNVYDGMTAIDYIPLNDEARERVVNFSSSIRDHFETLGVDLTDPRIYYAVLAGASVVGDFMAQEVNDPGKTIAPQTLVMKALVNNRPSL